ncbi:PREDICTED: uncharacterized protein LOC104613198 [Nelumbo nucifera]|uniref:Uncharacterized protein LOC104613198 n=1 Tax=Nelumbo nucifera TaxID=4432 RepID=A0A1U8BCN9_NELNU|nr:PREDICTED: uncharacterized protein LOC104613198 [Nelumbo nucifera]
MARTNKYASINFNDIYEKKNNLTTSNKPNSASSASLATINPPKAHLYATRTHGGMLVLSRPSPKPQPQPQQQTQSQPLPSLPSPPPPTKPDSDRTRIEQESISLRPLGRTGSSLTSSPSPSPSPSPATLTKERVPETPPPSLPSPKLEIFVPPHLRPGFVGKEERFIQEGHRQQGFRSRELGHGNGHHGSPNRYGEDGRPKSGGHERMRRGSGLGGGGGDSDPADMNNRPRSSGNHSSSSGWYGSYRSPQNHQNHF